MDGLTLLFFVGGLALLVGGAEWLVRGASVLATAVGISPLVIGLTVVAFGTSAPELAVSVMAAVAGESDLAIGNVVGSNISNILLILGLSACIAPLVVSAQVVRREVPIMIGASLVVLVMSVDGQISRVDGALLVSGVITYTALSIRDSRREARAAKVALDALGDRPLRPSGRGALLWESARVLAGLGLLVVGTTGVVRGAISMAEAMGVSELLIGLTVVAIGTSLPEAATSIVATMKGERDLAVGGAVGSNIFNLLAILGITALVRPIGIPAEVLAFDLPMMIAVAVACLPVFFTGGTIARWEGGVFVAYYVAYTAYLVLDATNHDAFPTYRTMMLLFVAPLTALTLGVLGFRSWGRHRHDGEIL
jgi:cation:H+ antiporter